MTTPKIKNLKALLLLLILVVTMTACNQETAEPDSSYYTLTVNSSSGGMVTQPGEGEFLYEEGDSVPLGAESKEMWEFSHWSGDTYFIDDSSERNTYIVMESDAEITANYEELKGANYQLSLEEKTAEEVKEGEIFNCYIVAENTGEIAGEKQTVEFYWDQVGDSGIADETKEIELLAGESQEITFSCEIDEKEGPGKLDYHVSGQDDSLTGQVEVLRVGEFIIRDFNAPQEVEVEEEIEVTVEIENTGDVKQTQEIVYYVDREEKRRHDLTLTGEEAQTVEFSHHTSEEEAGETKIIEILTEDDSITEELNVLQPDPTIEKEADFLGELDYVFGFYFITEGKLRIKNANQADKVSFPEEIITEGNHTEKEKSEIKLDSDKEFIEGEGGDLIVDFAVENLLDLRSREDQGEDVEFVLLDEAGNILDSTVVEIQEHN